MKKVSEFMQLELFEYVDKDLPKGFAPYYIYNMIVNGVEVGRLVLREGSDEERYYDGHIGYHVYEEYRGHGYAYQACLELRRILDLDHLIMTCDPVNIASRKTIEKLNCKYIETKTIPNHLRKLFGKDEKEKMIYIWK